MEGHDARRGAELDRVTLAMLALHDYGSRDGATSKSVLAAMKAEGFSNDEIAAAARKYGA